MDSFFFLRLNLKYLAKKSDISANCGKPKCCRKWFKRVWTPPACETHPGFFDRTNLLAVPVSSFSNLGPQRYLLW